MAKKKVISEKNIITAYMKFTLDKGVRPSSVYAFAQHMGIKENDFYKYFGSFEKTERAIFTAFFDNTMSVLKKNEEYQSFDAKNKLISFYYTFFEVLKANRSFVVFALGGEKLHPMHSAVLSDLKKLFIAFVDEIGIETIDLKQEKLEKAKSRGIKEGSWAQFLFILKFWLEDGSANFEKTDLLIEKAVTTGFVLLDATTLSSVFDLGKFLYKEKIMGS